MKMQSVLLNLLIGAFLICGIGIVNGQDSDFIRFGKSDMYNDMMGYNYFMGDDAANFPTTINGFGSGFFDVFAGRMAYDFLEIGGKHVYLSIGTGLVIGKYRLADNYVMQYEDNVVQFVPDPNEMNSFENSFFSYDKAKIVYGAWTIPAHLNFQMGNVRLAAGGMVDLYLSGKYKRKYHNEGGEKMKDVIRNKEFKNYNINKTKYGVSAKVIHTKWGVGLGVTYMMTPFFSGENDPQLNEVRISLLIKEKKK